jgi:hypothetical protein
VYRVPNCSNELHLAVGWFNPNVATPDLLCTCYPSASSDTCPYGPASCGQNSVGNQQPHSGSFLAGLHIINQTEKWGEYAATKLRDTMTVGQKYYVEYYTCQGFGPSGCGPQILLTTDSPSFAKYHFAEPQLFSGYQLYPITDIYGIVQWVKVSGVITADRPYRYLTIGNYFHLSDPRLSLQYPDDTLYLGLSFFVDDVKVLPIIPPHLGPDRYLCDNDSTILDAGVEATSYIWSTGDSSRTIRIRTGGTYWVGAINEAGYAAYDTITIRTHKSPIIDLGRDSAICSSQPVYIPLSPGAGFTTYRWSPGGETDDSILVTDYGSYAVTVENENGCYKSDTISIYENCPHCISDVKIYPNPSFGDLSVSLRCEYDYSDVAWSVIDALGQVCERGTVDIDRGNNLITIPREQLSSGIYLYLIDIPCAKQKLKFCLLN